MAALADDGRVRQRIVARLGRQAREIADGNGPIRSLPIRKFLEELRAGTIISPAQTTARGSEPSRTVLSRPLHRNVHLGALEEPRLERSVPVDGVGLAGSLKLGVCGQPGPQLRQPLVVVFARVGAALAD